VLKGSCGVEYRLILTEAGERKYGERYDYGKEEYGRGQRKGGLGEKLFTFVFWAIFLGEYHLLFADYELSKLTSFFYRYRRPYHPLNLDRRCRWQRRRRTTRWRLGRRRRRMGRRRRRRPRRPTSTIFFIPSSLQAILAICSWFLRLAPWLLYWRGDRRSGRLRNGEPQQPRSHDRSSRTVKLVWKWRRVAIWAFTVVWRGWIVFGFSTI
jgi:hypothetical protein